MRAIVSGSCGLVGFSTCSRLLDEDWEVIGIDNNQRASFFGERASTLPMLESLDKSKRYCHWNADIRNEKALRTIFHNGADLIVHCAAQPSHDYATSHIQEDFSINALGTLNMLQLWRETCSASPFIHVSTSKVYGDNPNRLEFIETDTRYDLHTAHSLWHGIPETFSVDGCLHSFFGVSKLSGDLLAQEFGKHFDMPVGIFRPGCITGGHHKGVELHGFLQYLMQCVYTGKEYTIFGYKGKQVRCNVHSTDLVKAFMTYANRPTPGAVYNVGGRGLDCSMNEAIAECERLCGRKANIRYSEQVRTGDHQWWISNAHRLRRELGWQATVTLPDTFAELYEDVRRTA